MPENRHNFQGPSVFQVPKFWAQGTKLYQKNQKCSVCGEAHSHKNCPNKDQRKPKCANCRRPHVANYWGCPACKDQAFRQHVVQKQISYASILKQASPPPPSNRFNFTANCLLGQCGHSDCSATTVHQKPA